MRRCVSMPFCLLLLPSSAHHRHVVLTVAWFPAHVPCRVQTHTAGAAPVVRAHRGCEHGAYRRHSNRSPACRRRGVEDRRRARETVCSMVPCCRCSSRDLPRCLVALSVSFLCWFFIFACTCTATNLRRALLCGLHNSPEPLAR